MNLEQRAYELLRDQARNYEAKALEVTTRVATWLLIANAAMLVLLFNAIIQGHITQPGSALPIARWFAVGLGTAFVAKCAVLASLVRNTQMTNAALRAGTNYDFAMRDLAAAEQRGTPLASDAPQFAVLKQTQETSERIQAIGPKLVRYMLVAWVMLAVAASATAGGVLIPLLDAGFLEQLAPGADLHPLPLSEADGSPLTQP